MLAFFCYIALALYGGFRASPPSPGRARRAKRDEARRSTGLAVAGRVLWLVAAPVAPALAAGCVGWVAAAFAVREYPSEVGARRALERGRSLPGQEKRLW
ncbi:hypothetical protein JHN63_50645 [Streptomyces sp. MBT65]|nr:hypothetical protein [Streptomyces sp. MBT65]